MSKRRPGQSGYVLLEALVAILVFSLGLLGIVGFQASAMKISTDSQFRTNAAMLADELIAQMSVSDFSTLTADYSETGAKYRAWYNNRLVGLAKLPNPSASVEITPGSTSTTMLVRVCIDWHSPGEKDVVGLTPASACARPAAPTVPWKFQTQAFLF